MRGAQCFSIASCFAALAVSSIAGAQQLRFSQTQAGEIIGTGNTLGLSHASSKNGPGTADSIGTFISLDGTSRDTSPADLGDPWPLGTTSDWTKNGSTAVLTLPTESQVTYAELVWGGSWDYGGEVTDESLLDSPVKLGGGGASMSVTPDSATKLDINTLGHNDDGSTFQATYYIRSADVTSFVQAHGSGTYSVGGVPATQTETINSLNAAGWTLVVAVHDTSAPVRNLSIFVGGSWVDQNSTVDYSVSGFCTSPSGAVTGHAVVSALEGDAVYSGDQLLISSDGTNFVNLSGPNNPAQNFFCSQINGSDGTLDTHGSFGTKNADAQGATNVSGGRQGWDVTTVPVSSAKGQLTNSQTSAVIRTSTDGDSYVPTLVAFAVDVNAPDFTGTGSAITTDKTKVALGDTLEVTLDLANTGLVTAQGVSLKLPLDSGLSLTSFKMDGQSGDINGNPVDTAALANGVDAGKLTQGQSRHVVVDLSVATAPSGGASSFLIQPEWDYQFELCNGGAPLPENYTELAIVAFDAGGSASTGSNNAASSGNGGSSGNGSMSGGSANGGGSQSGTGGGLGEGGASVGGGSNGGEGGGSSSPPLHLHAASNTGGCGCVLPGEAPPMGRGAALAIAASLVAFAARKRRGTPKAPRIER